MGYHFYEFCLSILLCPTIYEPILDFCRSDLDQFNRLPSHFIKWMDFIVPLHTEYFQRFIFSVLNLAHLNGSNNTCAVNTLGLI